MSVSFGLRTKRQKLGGSAVTQSFVEAQIASDAAAPNLTAEEALEESLRQQARAWASNLPSFLVAASVSHHSSDN